MKIGLIGLTVALSATLSGCLDMEMKKPWYPYYLKCPDGFTKATINSLEECPEDTKCEVVVDPEDPSHVQYCRESPVDYSSGGGVNCEAGSITVSKSEHQNKCMMADSADEIDESLIGDEEHYPCYPGKLPGKYCRKVTAENPGSLVDVREGQRCTDAQANPGNDTLRIHMMDIGQGDSIWIQTPTGKNVLIDGGEGGAVGKTSSGPIVTDYLNTHGFPYQSTFDAVILTHPHSDHFGGFSNIFNQKNAESYKLANYLDPMDLPAQADVPTSYTQWITTMKSIVTDPAHIYMPANAKFHAGDSLPEDFFGADIQTQYIISNNTYKDANDASIVFKLTYKDVSFIFSGDATAALEGSAIATGVPLDAQFFKVCHHGSGDSSTQAFLDAIWQNIERDKRYAVISSGRGVFGGGKAYIPTAGTLNRILDMIEAEHLLSTTAGDDAKREFETYRDDNILIVVKPNGESYACYNGTN